MLLNQLFSEMPAEDALEREEKEEVEEEEEETLKTEEPTTSTDEPKFAEPTARTTSKQ